MDGDGGSVAGQRGESSRGCRRGPAVRSDPSSSGKWGEGLKPESWGHGHLLLWQVLRLVCYLKCPQEPASRSFLEAPVALLAPRHLKASLCCTGWGLLS